MCSPRHHSLTFTLIHRRRLSPLLSRLSLLSLSRPGHSHHLIHPPPPRHTHHTPTCAPPAPTPGHPPTKSQAEGLPRQHRAHARKGNLLAAATINGQRIHPIRTSSHILPSAICHLSSRLDHPLFFSFANGSSCSFSRPSLSSARSTRLLGAFSLDLSQCHLSPQLSLPSNPLRLFTSSLPHLSCHHVQVAQPRHLHPRSRLLGTGIDIAGQTAKGSFWPTPLRLWRQQLLLINSILQFSIQCVGHRRAKPSYDATPLSALDQLKSLVVRHHPRRSRPALTSPLPSLLGTRKLGWQLKLGQCECRWTSQRIGQWWTRILRPAEKRWWWKQWIILGPGACKAAAHFIQWTRWSDRRCGRRRSAFTPARTRWAGNRGVCGRIGRSIQFTFGRLPRRPKLERRHRLLLHRRLSVRARERRTGGRE